MKIQLLSTTKKKMRTDEDSGKGKKENETGYNAYFNRQKNER